MLKHTSLRTILCIWAAWALIVIGYQTLVDARMPPNRPDYALEWTPGETGRTSLSDRLYLNEPFMNRQVAWDSEYYLSISIVGYQDENVPFLRTRGGSRIPLNYAFFPLYPAVMAGVSAPLRVLDMNPIATATLAGVIVSLAGTLAGMVGLYALTRDELEDAGAVRTAFYLLIFPSGFFLAQVYTEGLFVGLAFCSLALMRYKHFFWAAVLAGLATWTRAVGAALIVPLALAWASSIDWRGLSRQSIPWRRLAMGLVILIPAAAYIIWRSAVGRQFDMVEDQWFGRTLFDWERFQSGMQFALDAIANPDGNLQRRAYFLIDLGSAAFALVACLFTLRRYPGVALFSLIALVIALTSGSPQGWVRFVLVLPSIYLFLGWLGRSMAFDRGWTIASTLLMGLLAYLYTFDLWVA